MPDFQHSVSLAIKPLPYRFRKNRVRTSRSCRWCWGLCAVIARQAQNAGRRKRAPSFVRKRVSVAAGQYERQIWKNRTRSYVNGLMAMANLRKRRTLFFTYATEFLRINVILTYFCNGKGWYGNGGTDTWRWKPRITQVLLEMGLPSFDTVHNSACTFIRSWQNCDNGLTEYFSALKFLIDC